MKLHLQSLVTWKRSSKMEQISFLIGYNIHDNILNNHFSNRTEKLFSKSASRKSYSTLFLHEGGTPHISLQYFTSFDRRTIDYVGSCGIHQF